MRTDAAAQCATNTRRTVRSTAWACMAANAQHTKKKTKTKTRSFQRVHNNRKPWDKQWPQVSDSIDTKVAATTGAFHLERERLTGTSRMTEMSRLPHLWAEHSPDTTVRHTRNQRNSHNCCVWWHGVTRTPTQPGKKVWTSPTETLRVTAARQHEEQGFTTHYGRPDLNTVSRSTLLTVSSRKTEKTLTGREHNQENVLFETSGQHSFFKLVPSHSVFLQKCVIVVGVL